MDLGKYIDKRKIMEDLLADEIYSFINSCDIPKLVKRCENHELELMDIRPFGNGDIYVTVYPKDNDSQSYELFVGKNRGVCIIHQLLVYLLCNSESDGLFL